MDTKGICSFKCNAAKSLTRTFYKKNKLLTVLQGDYSVISVDKKHVLVL